MKKKTIIVVLAFLILTVIGFCTFAHINPYFRLVGSWAGDGTLDLLGDSPFDGALELTFDFDRTGYVVTEQGETAFTYDVRVRDRKEWDIIILDGGNGFSHGQKFIVDGNILNIIRDDGTVSFTRR